MCGIAGIYKFNKSLNIIYNPDVLNILEHRGPDDKNYHPFNDAILYHTRLSIIDLSEHSRQPFFLNENKCIVFNGEIFNFKELAKQTDIPNPISDTEVLINYFNKFKINGLNKINGFFSFAFFDNQKNELFVVRDRFGEKPLYYFCDENIFAFASEIFPLLTLIQKKISINSDVLYTYFRLHYMAGEHSILNGIKKLPPGHYIHIQNQSFNLQQWYALDNNKHTSANFEELLNDAVIKRLTSDAPVGTFLSGGIDSSIVCALAKKHIKELHTFSMGYQSEKLYNETADALKVANHIKSIHHNFEITTDEIITHIPHILNSIDVPFADSSAINVFFLSQKIKPYATVALSGDGADELLMGYNKHKIFLIQNQPILKFLFFLAHPVFAHLPENRSKKFLNYFRKIKKFILANQLTALNKYIFLSQWAQDSYIHQLMSPSLNNHYFYSLFEKYKNLNDTELFNRADIEIVLSNDMLYKIDFFGMLNAVEIRSPFLDHRVVEFLYHAPFQNKIHHLQQKYLLRKTFSHQLPASIFKKKKTGFEIPLHKILPQIVQNETLLKKDYILHQNIFNYNRIEKLLKELPDNLNDSSLKLWAILIFQHWYKKFEPYIEKNV